MDDLVAHSYMTVERDDLNIVEVGIIHSECESLLFLLLPVVTDVPDQEYRIHLVKIGIVTGDNVISLTLDLF